MDGDFVYTASIIVTVIFLLIAVFQVLLATGLPLGEYAMGGFYKKLPKTLRVVSLLNALILVLMGFVFLQHGRVIDALNFLPTTILVWIITIFLAINTLANLFSRSKKEAYIMTPISGITCILCLLIALA